MKKDDVIGYFKTATKAAEALGYTVGAISNWPERVPENSAQRLHLLTGGALKYDPVEYGRDPAPSKPIPPAESDKSHVAV